MENRIGKDFESLAQRIVYSYAGTLPAFKAVKSETVSEESQKQLYDFICNIAHKLFDHPQIIGLSDHPDDYYHDWELQNRKPDLIKTMRTIKKKIDEFYMLLLKIGELGVVKNHKLYIEKKEMKFTGKTLSKLGCFGLKGEVQKEDTIFTSDEYPEMFPAWKLLTSTAMQSAKRSLRIFSQCLLDSSFAYSRDIFYRLIENKPALNRMEEFFVKNGYQYYDGRENEISMDWAKNYGKKDEPLKESWAEREHGGLSISYDYKKKNQLLVGLRIPKFKELLSHFNEMDDTLKEFIIEKTKKCDHCGYCTQTDKTGTRKKQLTCVNYHGNYSLCLLFPGFSFRWTSINDEIASNIIQFLMFADKVFGKIPIREKGD